MMKVMLLITALFVSSILQAGKVDTISIYSNSMHKQIKCVVITPNKYKQSKQRFAVVYLLHGHSGNYAQWLNDAPQLSKKADELQLILVCPDGGYASWYFNSPVDKNFQYETFTSKELVPYIDKNYKTIANKQHRAITGFSMGGHGALYISIRNKNIFGLAGSICGGVDIRPFTNNWDLKKSLGDTVCCKQNWERNTVINLVPTLKNGEIKLIIDCGWGDFFLKVNRALHAKLLQLKINHQYIERPGQHNREYWGSAINLHLEFFKKEFSK
jgi:S-formylglutathione hydrolase FrmB